MCYWPSQIVISECYSSFKKAAGHKEAPYSFTSFYLVATASSAGPGKCLWPNWRPDQHQHFPLATAQLWHVSGPLQGFGWTTSSTTSSPCATPTRTWTSTLTASSAASCAWTPCSVSGCPGFTALPPLLAPQTHCPTQKHCCLHIVLIIYVLRESKIWQPFHMNTKENKPLHFSLCYRIGS